MDNIKSNKHIKVLVIDDNKDLAEILCELIGLLGHMTISSLNGQDGIKKAKDYHPDAIICDIGLPGLNGYEVAQLLKRDKDLKDVFLVALSGYAGPDDLKLSKEAGFNRHLSKPADISSIERVLAEAVMSKKVF